MLYDVNKTGYKNIDHNPDMGLDDTICTKKDYYCKSHRVFLSAEDVEKKHCLCKPSADMMEVKRCIKLIKAEEMLVKKQSPKVESKTRRSKKRVH